MMATTTNREVEVELSLKAAAGPITNRDLQKLMWHRDQKLAARLLDKTPTETGKTIRQK
jgi:hypothetical protein